MSGKLTIFVYSMTCCRLVCHPCSDHFPGMLPGYWIQLAWNPTGRSEYHSLGNSFLLHTECTVEPTSPGTPQLYTKRLETQWWGYRKIDGWRKEHWMSNFSQPFFAERKLQKAFILCLMTHTQSDSLTNQCCILVLCTSAIEDPNPYILLHTAALSLSALLPLSHCALCFCQCLMVFDSVGFFFPHFWNDLMPQ